MSKRWQALLVISLTLNIALVGFVIGKATSGARDLSPMTGPGLLPRIVRELPTERRADVIPVVREHRQSQRERVRRLRTSHRQMQEALYADPYEQARLNRSLADMRLAFAEAQEAEHEAFAELVTLLTAEERAELAKRLSRPHRAKRSDGSKRAD